MDPTISQEPVWLSILLIINVGGFLGLVGPAMIFHNLRCKYLEVTGCRKEGAKKRAEMCNNITNLLLWAATVACSGIVVVAFVVVGGLILIQKIWDISFGEAKNVFPRLGVPNWAKDVFIGRCKG